MKGKFQKFKVMSWKNKPMASELKRFKKDVNAKGNVFKEF
jgi:hypothetical protein